MKEYRKPVAVATDMAEGVFMTSGTVAAAGAADSGFTYRVVETTRDQPSEYYNAREFNVFVTNNTGSNIAGEKFSFDVDVYGNVTSVEGWNVSLNGTKVTLTVEGQWIENGKELASGLWVKLYGAAGSYDYGLK